MRWGERRAPRAGSHRSTIAAMAAALAILGTLLPPVAGSVRADDTITIVTAETVVPGEADGPRDAASHAWAGAEPTVPPTLERPGSPAGAAPLVVQRAGGASVGRPAAPSAGAPTLSDEPGEGAAAMNYRQNGSALDAYGARATLAVLPSRSVVADRQTMHFLYTSDLTQVGMATSLRTFFNVPSTEGAWGPTVIASLKQDRFVAVLPSFQGPSRDCAKGYLNLAVSKTNSPRGQWFVYRIPMPDAWTDLATLGSSDDKVVISTNQWDLSAKQSDCLGGAWEGARMRVMDWKDLLDGGSLTVKDVTPSGATSYWSWMPVAATPGTTSTSAGTTLRVVVDRLVDGWWGNVGYGTITGSARKGTAKLASNRDLTAALGLRPLLAPPETILGMASGNGGLDERIVSAASHGSRLYFTAHDSCKLLDDTDWRSCARIVELDTSTSVPSVVQDVMFVDMAADTFLPFAGVARDGTAFMVMGRSSAVSLEPTDQYVVYREPGELFYEGGAEVPFRYGDYRPQGPTGMQGSVVPDPSDHRRVIAEYGVPGNSAGFARATRFTGNLTGGPAAAMTIGTGTGWANSWSLRFVVGEATGPAMFVRWSGRPDTTDTPGGPMLTTGIERPIEPYADLTMTTAALGGSATDPYTVYHQWRAGDGRWSPVIATPIEVDQVAPTVAVPTTTLLPGKVVDWAVPVEVAWDAATDDEAGLRYLEVNREGGTTGEPHYALLQPSATACTLRVHVLATTAFHLSAVDLAGNVGTSATPRFMVRTAYPWKDVQYSSGWTTETVKKALYGKVRYATKAGAKATYSFTGRAFGWVTTMGPNRGKAEIWVDGALAQTVDLYRSSTSYRELVWTANWDTAGAHTVVIKVLGTKGRPRVDLEVLYRI